MNCDAIRWDFRINGGISKRGKPSESITKPSSKHFLKDLVRVNGVNDLFGNLLRRISIHQNNKQHTNQTMEYHGTPVMDPGNLNYRESVSGRLEKRMLKLHGVNGQERGKRES